MSVLGPLSLDDGSVAIVDYETPSVFDSSLTVLLVSRDARKIFNKAGGVDISLDTSVCAKQSDTKK
jgi:hypothetical protein